ncbi:MAG: hypothetical protein K6G81_11315 [Lachnospiraceae bacterium]|nr:hypothetical protein [Lachnospiraceae bacterium]
MTVSAGELGLNEDECAEIRAWDVTFYYNGEEIQPKDGKSVSVNLNIDGMGDDVEAYHIHDGAVSEIQIDEEGTVSASTFSLLAAVAKGKKDEDNNNDGGIISNTNVSLYLNDTKTLDFSDVVKLVTIKGNASSDIVEYTIAEFRIWFLLTMLRK